MQLLVLVLNKVECLPKIMRRFFESGIHGSTIIDSLGMLQYLGHETVEPPPIFGSLRKYINPSHDPNKTVFVLLKEEQVETARKIINEVTGGLDKPNVGILFVLPTVLTEGAGN